MTALDRFLAQFLNQSIAVSEVLDRALREIAFNDAFKGFVAIGLVLVALVRAPARCGRLNQARAVIAGFGLVMALACNRALASVLPFVPRPLQDQELALKVPIGLPARTLGDLSSFPSDHAVLFGGLATLTTCLSRRFGIVAWLHAIVVVLLPRMWLGLHWFSDLAVGVLVGACTVLLVDRRQAFAHWLLRKDAWWQRHRALCALLIYAMVYALITLFDPFVRVVRWIASMAAG